MEMLQSNAAPYGTARTASQLWRLNRADVRLPSSSPRLLWHDRIELAEGRYVIRSRRWNGEGMTVEGVPLREFSIQCSHMSWRTPAAFDAVSGTSNSWLPVFASDVRIDPTELKVRAEICNSLQSLGLPECTDLNPWLEGRLGGKRLLIPSLSLILAVTAPSPCVFFSLMHPLDAKFYAVRTSSGSVHIRSTGGLRIGDFSDRDLACLAYWLQGRNACFDNEVFAAILGQEPLPAPRAQGVFRFLIEGYENRDSIVVRRLGQLRSHQCWPVDWEEVCLINERGLVGSRILALPGGLISRVYSP